MAKRIVRSTDVSTEEKIRTAARKIFTQKGFAASRTRDIAVEAGINLALLNYYFRSKEKLFDIVMAEKMQEFFGLLVPILNDPKTTLEKKIRSIAEYYIDLILENPDLPLFVLSELKTGHQGFLKIVQKSDFFNSSVFIKQLSEKRPDIVPFQFLVSLLGMCLFPFLMRPVLQKVAGIPNEEFKQLMLERKELIPSWTSAMLKLKKPPKK